MYSRLQQPLTRVIELLALLPKRSKFGVEFTQLRLHILLR